MSAKLDDIQSWWEVPSIAYFCSLFRTAFNLLDFDIEELEEALLTDGSEECASTLLTELIVRLLNGCLETNDVSAFNYQMFLRRLFRQKCQETGRYNPFNTDIDFQFLPLRTKVEILYALCDFRLDADDVFDLFKNLEAESLRVEPLGWDDNTSAYWYFFGTRLYREDHKPKSKNKKRKSKEEKRKKELYGDDWLEDPDVEKIWQVVCFTESDWANVTEKFKNATSTVEKQLYQSLSENFLPEIPRLFQEKERLQRKRLLELAPRRTSSRVLQKIKLKEEEDKSSSDVKEAEVSTEEKERKDLFVLSREHRAKRREQMRSKSSSSSDSSDYSSSDEKKTSKKMLLSKSKQKKSKNSPTLPKGEPPPAPEPIVKTGRKTNNSLACATGQILIPDSLEPSTSNSTRKILKGSQIFSQSKEDIQTDMYKVLEQLTAHEDAWPFMDPVEEEYAPNYYAVIRRPMDLKKMEERLDSGYYTDFNAFKSDFKLIVNNCRLYNGQDNEYTTMVDSLQEAFNRLTERYVHHASSSDEEIAVEYQIPTPPRKHKMKDGDDSPPSKRRKTSASEDPNSSRENDKEGNCSKEIKRSKERKSSKDKKSSDDDDDDEDDDKNEKKEKKKLRELRKSKDGKAKKKHKHHHGKHSKCHKKNSHEKSGKKDSKHVKKSKKDKHRKKKRRHSQKDSEIVMKRSTSMESLESSNRSRSASPLPSIHTPTPSPAPSPSPAPAPSPSHSPAPSPSDKLSNSDFFKDKYDKIKERRRQAAKNKGTPPEKRKSNEKAKAHAALSDKNKNQKLRETIEKLKAKNEKYKETLLFNNLFSASSQTSADKSSISSETLAEIASPKDSDQFDDDESDNGSQKSNSGKKRSEGRRKKGTKKVSVVKNEIAREALEQAVKDISKWLDEGPKNSARSTASDSPSHTISTEDQDSRLDDDNLSEKSLSFRKELRKRPSSRESRIAKRRDIHRTIERLYPGKSKGNLIAAAASPKSDEVVIPLGPHNKPREVKSVLTTKVDEMSPKLSLGSVLLSAEFTLGKDHKFTENDEKLAEKTKTVKAKKEEEKTKDKPVAEKAQEQPVPEPQKVEEKVVEKIVSPEEEKPAPEFSQEKATPNLSAWFKAFGAPKSTPAATKTQKKNEETEKEEKTEENLSDNKPLHSPKSVHKYDSPPDEISPRAEGGDSPTPNMISSRQRRTSTGSSVSERSSFSQDLDSPRHQMAHTSPLLRSPASPKLDDFQKITYPIINGTVRAGFYQDTASVKSSPEKSCSPRDGPKSPYSPYSQHVYANNASSTPNPHSYSDNNPSPLPTYGFNQPPPYYDTSKAAYINKPSKTHDDYTSLGPDGLYPKKTGNIGKLVGSSPARSPYSQHSPRSPYSQMHSPQTVPQQSPSNNQIAEPKTPTPTFPVKKRAYVEDTSVIKTTESHNLDHSKNVHKSDYHKYMQSMNPYSSDLTPTSVDDIALALGKKSEAMKINNITKDNTGISYMDKLNVDRHTSSTGYNGGVANQEEAHRHGSHSLQSSDKMDKTSSVDMVNMGYFPSELEKRSNISEADLLNVSKELQKASVSKFDIGAYAMNLGMNKMQASKYNTPKQVPKSTEHTITSNMLEFENIQAANQSISNFGMNEYDLSNKKTYTGAMQSNSPIDYGNWKNDNLMRKAEPAHSSYQSTYPMDNTELNKMKSNMTVPNAHASTYSKPIHSPQLQNLPGTRPPIIRGPMQHNLPSELRIPNPRVMSMGDVPISSADIMRRNIDQVQSYAMQKPDKIKPTQSSLPYKTNYSSPSPLPLDSLINLPVGFLSNDERYLAGFSSGSSLYDKNQMAQMFNKTHSSEAHAAVPTSSIYSQSNVNTSKDNSNYKTNMAAQAAQMDKSKQKRKKTDARQSPISSQVYQSPTSTSDVLSSVKNSLVPGSAFNFGPSGMGLGGSLYSEGSGFSLEDFRNSTANQFMAANYMAAAAAAHQRNTSEVNVEKLVKPAHQNAAHSGTGAFPFLGHGQTRGPFPFVGTDPSSPIYQQYLQRQRQEELLGAQIMGLYPSAAYHSGGLGSRQPFDSLNRPPWL